MMHNEWTSFVSAVGAIPRGSYYRHNIAGDLPTVDRPSIPVNVGPTKAGKLTDVGSVNVWGSYSHPDSCPASCPLRGGGGCFAETGPVANAWTITEGKRSFALQRKRSGATGELDRDRCLSLAAACQGLSAWTYTHHTGPGSFAVAQEMTAMGLTVNASANGLHEVDALADASRLPVVTVAPAAFRGSTVTAGGRRVVQCPATVEGSKVTCAGTVACGGDRGPLCARADRSIVIAFPAHGRRSAKAGLVSIGRNVSNRWRTS